MTFSIFSIETSCDETSVAILNEKGKILSHINQSQAEHKKFGGVVPEIASRAHLKILQEIIPISIKKANLSINEIDYFCATCGPGLIGGLLVGSTIAKSLAISLKKPFYPINHLEAHLLSPKFKFNMQFPNLTILLTGGHTQIYLVKNYDEYILLGETVDDAIGESFDKVAKMLELGYPGGAKIEKLAKKGKNTFEMPHPFKFKKNLNFSFSGIKTAVNLIVKKEVNNKIFKQNIAASFQKKIIEILENKIITSLDYVSKKGIIIKDISVVGGVAANNEIRNSILYICKKRNCRLIYPPKKLCGDNAAIVGLTCLKKIEKNHNPDIFFNADPRLSIN